jgi:hypothetical protein
MALREVLGKFLGTTGAFGGRPRNNRHFCAGEVGRGSPWRPGTGFDLPRPCAQEAVAKVDEKNGVRASVDFNRLVAARLAWRSSATAR